MKLVKDWKRGLRWWSMRGLLALAALPPVWMSLPPDVKDMMPADWQPWVLTAIALGTAVGRLKDQGEDA